MKKLVVMFLLTIISFNGLTVVAQTNEIEELAEDISRLEEELSAKKAVLENLSKDYKKTIEFEELNQDVTDLSYKGYKLTLIERGIDSKNYDLPVAYWLIKAEITSNERQFEDTHASPIIETKEYTDFAEDEKKEYYKENENGELVMYEHDYNRKYSKGHIYYYKILMPIYDEDANYYISDSLSDSGLKIPMYNQDEAN